MLKIKHVSTREFHLSHSDLTTLANERTTFEPLFFLAHFRNDARDISLSMQIGVFPDKAETVVYIIIAKCSQVVSAV